jgi:superfamily II DNA or RNA helicase
MESSGFMPRMPLFENLRRGQREVVQKFQEMTIGSPSSVIAKLPTGYGKTKAAAASFAYLKISGKVDFMLFVVPRTAQSNQCSESVPEELSKYNIETKSFDFGDNPSKAHRAVRRNSACVFAITVQALISKTTREALQSAMSTGRWLVVVDEYHHYGVDGKWTEWLGELERDYTIAMSATPDREDCPSPFGQPEISISYIQAFKEGAVKKLSLHSYDYKINAVKQDGEIISFTTAELQSKISKTISVEDVIVARKAKWQPDYISPIIMEPIERLNNLAMYGIKSQIIVQAIDCSHARFVCEQIESLLTDGMTVDWVGGGKNGRPDKENAAVLNRFCPPKNEDGFREWSLDILVNVGMAGEGLDTTDVTEVVFLTNPRGTISDRQIMGRAARIMKVGPAHQDKIIGHINVDAGCDLTKFLGSKIMDVFDSANEFLDEEPEPDEQNGDDDPSDGDDAIGPIIDWKNLIMVLSVELVDIKHDPEYIPLHTKLLSDLSDEFPNSQKDMLDAAANKILVKYLNDKAEKAKSRNQSINDKNNRDQVIATTKTVVGKAIKFVIMKRNLTPSDELAKEVSIRINSAKKAKCGAIDKCSGDEINKHVEYLQSIDSMIMNGEMPECLK